jgi:signal transduction histidine kinase
MATPTSRTWQKVSPKMGDSPSAGAASGLPADASEMDRLRRLAELGRMAATVAHEVRNPLAGISANAELVRESLSDPADQECVDLILGEVERLGRLVTDLLYYAREREPVLVPTDLAQLARSSTDLCQSSAAKAGVTLRVDGVGRARVDVELSRQALLNVVRNAIEACRPGGNVVARVGDGRIAICDSGCGVPEQVRERLFEPFVTGRTRGLGLGGAVAKRCQLRQSGDLILESTSENGSVFVLSWTT